LPGPDTGWITFSGTLLLLLGVFATSILAVYGLIAHGARED
jgi:hypothetical protein